MIHKDGRRTETGLAGGERIIQPVPHTDGTWTETTFHATGTENGAIVYEEGETVDITERMRRAHESNEQRRWQMINAGLRSMGCEVPSCRCVCHHDGTDKGQR